MGLQRVLAVAVLALLSAPSPTTAQEWARKMFTETSHDFGTVARGAKAEYSFKFKNLYKEDIHIASVRSNCGCTTPQITTRTLKSLEEGEILAVYNTRSFLGARSAVVTVLIDEPYTAEVQLKINGYIRSDVVLSPGSVQLGNVQHGAEAEKRVDVNYAGRNDWEITDVRTESPYLEAELVETKRSGGQVGYEMLVRLTRDAPVGYINEHLTVVTNDARLRSFPVHVEGKVESEITVTPAPLFLGVVQPGEKVTKRLVVRGNRPFRVVSIDCDDDCFEFETSDASKPLHLIPVTFTAGPSTGKITGTIHIETDLGEGVVPELTAYAQVIER